MTRKRKKTAEEHMKRNFAYNQLESNVQAWALWGKLFVWWVMRDTSDWRWFFADCGGMGEILAGMKDEVLFETFWNNHQDPQTNAFWLVLFIWDVQVGRLGLRHLSNTIDWPLPWSNLFMSEVGKERGSPEHPQSWLLFLEVFDVQKKGFQGPPLKGAKVNSIHRLQREAINSCANAHMCASQKRGRGLQSGSKATKQAINSFLGMSLQASQRSLFLLQRHLSFSSISKACWRWMLILAP